MCVAQHNDILSTDEINQILNIPMYLLHNKESMDYVISSILKYDFDTAIDELAFGLRLTCVGKGMYVRILFIYKHWVG